MLLSPPWDCVAWLSAAEMQRSNTFCGGGCLHGGRAGEAGSKQTREGGEVR